MDQTHIIDIKNSYPTLRDVLLYKNFIEIRDVDEIVSIYRCQECKSCYTDLFDAMFCMHPNITSIPPRIIKSKL